MSIRSTVLLLAALAAASPSRPAFAQESPSSSVTIPQLLEKLTDPDYQARRKAMREVDSYLAAQDAAWFNTTDGEVKEQVASALQFNRTLTPWLLEVLKLPEPKKVEQIQLLTSRELAPLLGQLFSDDAGQRVEGVKKLGNVQSAGTDLLLNHFLSDDSLAVQLATMEDLWDRPASDVLVMSLWNIGVGNTMSSSTPRPYVKPEPPTFRGTPLVDGTGIRSMPMLPPSQKSVLAATAARQVLIHLKPPQIEPLVLKTLNDLAAKLNADESSHILYSPQLSRAAYDTAMALSELGEACQFKSAVPGFVALATVSITPDRQMYFLIGNGPEMAYYSIRTSPLHAVLALTNQDPALYEMRANPRHLPLWTTPTKAVEDHAVEKLKAWWKDNSSKYPTTMP